MSAHTMEELVAEILEMTKDDVAEIVSGMGDADLVRFLDYDRRAMVAWGFRMAAETTRQCATERYGTPEYTGQRLALGVLAEQLEGRAATLRYIASYSGRRILREVVLFDHGPHGVKILGKTTDAGLVKRVTDHIAEKEERKLIRLAEAEPEDESSDDPQAS